jgi:cytochrome c-type biogenesis protein CcmH
VKRAFALLLLVPAAALADPVMAPDPLSYTQLPDAGQERAAQSLMQTIRCVVCQGQSIADSDADLAGDMRAIVRHRIAAGEQPETIRGWLIARYGRWVSYKPVVEPITWPLWAAPLVLLLIGGWLARGTFRRRDQRRRRAP